MDLFHATERKYANVKFRDGLDVVKRVGVNAQGSCQHFDGQGLYDQLQNQGADPTRDMVLPVDMLRCQRYDEEIGKPVFASSTGVITVPFNIPTQCVHETLRPRYGRNDMRGSPPQGMPTRCGNAKQGIVFEPRRDRGSEAI